MTNSTVLEMWWRTQNLADCPIRTKSKKERKKKMLKIKKKKTKTHTHVLKSWMGILNVKTLLNLVDRISPFMFTEMGARRGESVTALCYTNNWSKSICPFCCGNSSVFLSITADIPGSLKSPGIYNLSTVILYMSKPVADLAVLRLLPCDN